MRLVREKMVERVEAHGGLPGQVEGMSDTCRAHQAIEPYRGFRVLLELYSVGEAPAESVVPAAGDAPDLLL